ncbi:hypothetical protein NKH24_06990 [Mesorhizobium sp. M1300]|uniref:hypothetical protein n=1 Tax=Mesorhizobium sp. M1300 TaxID=2957077 RepID=UPI00333DE824
MTVLAYSLASDIKGSWRIVFVPDELHLYVEFSPSDADTDPADWMSVDDFLARRPAVALQERARDSLVSLICNALTGRENQKARRPEPAGKER